MAALVSKKRGVGDISSIDPQKLNLQIFCSVRNSEETNGLKKVFAVAQISTSGGIRCDFVKRVGKEEITSIAKLDAYLIQRDGRGFHNACDTESQELSVRKSNLSPNLMNSNPKIKLSHKDMAMDLFDIDGRMEKSLRDTVTRPQECDHGCLFYLSSVEVDKKVQGKEIGLLMTHAVMNGLKDKWTLALTFPAPLHPDRSPDAKPDAFQLGVNKVSRYFARIGFVQVCGDKPHHLNKYWALEKFQLEDSIRVTKEESMGIVVQADKKPEKLDEINEEIRELLVSVSRLTNGPVMSQESKDIMVNQLEATMKEYDEMIAELLASKEHAKEQVEKVLEEYSKKKADAVLEIDAGCPNVELTEEENALGKTKLEKANAELVRINDSLHLANTAIETLDSIIAEKLAKVQVQMETCRKKCADLKEDTAESPQIQKFRTAMSEVIHRGGDVNEAKALHFAVANRLEISVIEMMVNEFGAQVNLQDDGGNTPLHVALCVPDVDANIISTLLKLGADKKIVDKEGKTPAQMGREHKTRTKKMFQSMGLANHPSIPARLEVIDKCIALLK